LSVEVCPMAKSAPPGVRATDPLSPAANGSRGCRRVGAGPLRCTAILREEHASILRLLDSLEISADAIRSGGAVRQDVFVGAFRLINVFVTQCHYAKDAYLLTVLRNKGMWPAADILEEHRDSLDFTAAMLRLLPDAVGRDRTARRMLAENATAYAGFMRAHIRREEMLVFSPADEVLTGRDDGAAAEAYARIDIQTCCPFSRTPADEVEHVLASAMGLVKETPPAFRW